MLSILRELNSICFRSVHSSILVHLCARVDSLIRCFDSLNYVDVVIPLIHFIGPSHARITVVNEYINMFINLCVVYVCCFRFNLKFLLALALAATKTKLSPTSKLCPRTVSFGLRRKCSDYNMTL